MSLLKSVVLGSEGSYNIFGTQANFYTELPANFTPPDTNLKGAGVISQLAKNLLSINSFHYITQLQTHLFVHEMGHALSFKILTGQNTQINIFYKHGGFTNFPPEEANMPDWKITIISLSGPMANVAFSSCKLVAATALKNYLSWPIATVLGSGAIICIGLELLYAYVSASKKDGGDFGIIARYGNTHLALATTALVCQVALGVFAAIKLAA